MEIKNVTRKNWKKNYDIFLAFLALSYNGRDMVVCNSFVHSVEDSTLMSIFDQFCFSFVFPGLPKMDPNRYT